MSCESMARTGQKSVVVRSTDQIASGKMTALSGVKTSACYRDKLGKVVTRAGPLRHGGRRQAGKAALNHATCTITNIKAAIMAEPGA